MANVFRVDPIGPLIKPAALLAAEAQVARGAPDERSLGEAQDGAIQQALLWQKELALPVLSDGELRRTHPDAPYCAALAGIRRRSTPSCGDWQSDWCVSGELHGTGRLSKTEVSFLLSKTQRPFKISLLAPSALALRMFEPGGPYPNLSALAGAFGRIIGAEVAALVKEGVAYVQLSCPAYAWLCDPAARRRLTLTGSALEDAFETLLNADIEMLKGIDRSSTTALGLHIGRWGGMDPASDTFERMLEKILPVAPVDRFLLEYAEPQAHDFLALASLPADKIAALGLVSSNKEPEDVAQIIARIDEAATRTNERNLAVSMRTGPRNDSALTAEALASRQRRSFETTLDAALQVWGLEL